MAKGKREIITILSFIGIMQQCCIGKRMFTEGLAFTITELLIPAFHLHFSPGLVHVVSIVAYIMVIRNKYMCK